MDDMELRQAQDADLEGIITGPATVQVFAETFDIEAFLQEAAQVGTELDRLLAGARGRELLTDLNAVTRSTANARWLTALAVFHGTTLTPSELFILIRLREALLNTVQGLEPVQQAFLGPALIQLLQRDRIEWVNIPFSTWQEELRLLKLMQGGAAGTIFI